VAQCVELAQQRRDELAPALAVTGMNAIKALGGTTDIAVERNGSVVSQRVRGADGGVDPAQAVAVKRHTGEDR
jgi:LmbE family N-acetylglucosaminyl deacetylase